MNITCMLQRIKATHLTGVVSVLRATRWWGWGSNPSVLAPLFIAPLYGDSQNVGHPLPTESASWQCGVDPMEGADDHGQGPPWPALRYFEMIQGEEIGRPGMVLS